MPRRKKPDPSNTLTSHEQIDLFMARGEEMWTSRVRREGLKVSFNVKWSIGEEVNHQIEEPDAEDFRSFLTIFRKFISPDSDIFLPKIYNLCHQYIANDECKEVLAEARAAWLEIQQHPDSGLSVTVAGRQLSPKDVVDIWINGHYFHDDVEGMRLLKIMNPLQHSATRAIFIDYVIETTNIIRHLAQTIRTAIERGWMKI
jgi:hypothetical protein